MQIRCSMDMSPSTGITVGLNFSTNLTSAFTKYDDSLDNTLRPTNRAGRKAKNCSFEMWMLGLKLTCSSHFAIRVNV